uniref:hypothetical protein n=1 Tax=Nostoc sp. 106C TaxID=1932667 RepID=UPI000B647414
IWSISCYIAENFDAYLLTKQKTEQLFWRGLGGRNRPPIGGLGENPPNLGFCPTDENSDHLN